MDAKNLDIYGHAPLPWSRATGLLEAAQEDFGDGTTAGDPRAFGHWFLQTVGPDGRPHSAGVGALWIDKTLYFTSGPRIGTLSAATSIALSHTPLPVATSRPPRR